MTTVRATVSLVSCFLQHLWERDTLSSVQFSCSVVSTSLWPPCCSTLPGFPVFTISQSVLTLMSIESMMLPSHLILCHPLLLLPSILPSIRVFPSESALCIRWPKYWNFSFSISPSSECSGLISFRIDWFDLLGVQETLGHPWISYGHSVTSLLWTKMLTSTRRVLSRPSIFVR